MRFRLAGTNATPSRSPRHQTSVGASFAMTPQSGFNPGPGNPYYNVNETPWYRGHVVYDNAAGGQTMNLWYTWDTQGQSGWTSQNVTGYSYSYDDATVNGQDNPVSYVAMQKTQATFLNPANNGTSWTADHVENYAYDPALDYLTSANYGNGGTTQTWTYDLSGNRTFDSNNAGTWTYDNLNRMSASPGLSYQNDTLGNRGQPPTPKPKL